MDMKEQVVNQSPVEVSKRPSKFEALFELSIIVFSATLAYSVDGYWIVKKLLRFSAPVVAIFISIAADYWIKEYEDNQYEKRVIGYIALIDAQLLRSDLSSDYKEDLRVEQSLHQEDLSTLLRERSERKIF